MCTVFKLQAKELNHAFVLCTRNCVTLFQLLIPTDVFSAAQFLGTSGNLLVWKKSNAECY